MRLIFKCRPTSTSLGEIIHMEQSLVGNVLSSSLITPPMAEDFSTRWTKKPESAKSREACIPAIPPPITITDPKTLLAMKYSLKRYDFGGPFLEFSMYDKLLSYVNKNWIYASVANARDKKGATSPRPKTGLKGPNLHDRLSKKEVSLHDPASLVPVNKSIVELEEGLPRSPVQSHKAG